MSNKRIPGALGSHAGLGPLPAPDLQADPCSADGTQTDYYTAGTVRRLLAAERERIRVLVEAVRDANAASQDEDDYLIYTPAVQRSWEALLRGLEGPNVEFSGRTRSAGTQG